MPIKGLPADMPVPEDDQSEEGAEVVHLSDFPADNGCHGRKHHLVVEVLQLGKRHLVIVEVSQLSKVIERVDVKCLP